MTSAERGTLVAVILGSGIVFLDSTVVNVALPSIGEDLRSTLLGRFAAQNLVYYGYLLTLSSLLILGGAANDLYGRKRMFTAGLVGFAATSLLCGVAPSIESLIAFRALQGAAGALLIPGSLALITTTFQGEAQGKAFGLWASASAATTMLGPFVGGLLVDSVSWRAVFLINLPLIAVAIWVTSRFVNESRVEQARGRMDRVGAFIAMLAIGGLSIGAIIGEQNRWSGIVPFAALAIGVLATIGFPLWMRRVSHPLVPLGLFGSRNFTVTNISTLLIYGALYVLFAFIVIFAQGTLGYSAAAAGLIAVPTTILLALFSSRFGRLAATQGPRRYMAAGPIVMAAGVAWFARMPADSNPWVLGTGPGERLLPPGDYMTDFLPGFIVFGLGLMMLVAPLTQALMNSVPGRHSGVASAINNAISRVGPQLAGALIFIAIAATFYGDLEARLPDTPVEQIRESVSPLNPPEDTVSDAVRAASREASTQALRVGMLFASGLLLAGGVVNGIWIRDADAVDAEADEPREGCALRLCAEPTHRHARS